MSTTTSAVSTTMVNAAFLQEVKDANLQFWQNVHDFKRLLNSGAGPIEHASKLVKLLGELRGSMAVEFSLEETYGYIDGSYSVHSVSAAKASVAKRQHRDLYLSLHEISESAEEAQYRGTIVEDFPQLLSDCQEFLTLLETHEKHESELIRYELGMGRFGG